MTKIHAKLFVNGIHFFFTTSQINVAPSSKTAVRCTFLFFPRRFSGFSFGKDSSNFPSDAVLVRAADRAFDTWSLSGLSTGVKPTPGTVTDYISNCVKPTYAQQSNETVCTGECSKNTAPCYNILVWI